MRPLGCRQERLLVVILEDGGRSQGLMDSVGRSLLARGLVHAACPFGVFTYTLTPKGEELALVCRLKEKLAK